MHRAAPVLIMMSASIHAHSKLANVCTESAQFYSPIIDTAAQFEGFPTVYCAQQVEATILAGPRSNLAAFLKALGRLEASNQFLEKHRCAGTSVTQLQADTSYRSCFSSYTQW